MPAPDSNAKFSLPSGACTGTLGCRTGKAGILTVTYLPSSRSSQGGGDTLIASPSPRTTSAAAPAEDTYDYQAIDHFSWNQDPIAAAGSLKPGSNVQLTVTAFNAVGKPVPRAQVYISLTRAQPTTGSDADNATVSCGKTKLPGYCLANNAGQVTVSYAISTHVYEMGSDTLTAAVDPAGTNQASDEYTYLARAGTKVTSYSWSPNPIAPAASLDPGTTVPVTLTALSANDNPVPGAPVVITFALAPGSDATVTPPKVCTTGTGKVVTFRCTTSKSGDLTFTFTSSKAKARGGSDGLTATTYTGVTSGTSTALPTATDTYSND
jgi:hypothetical protein